MLLSVKMMMMMINDAMVFSTERISEELIQNSDYKVWGVRRSLLFKIYTVVFMQLLCSLKLAHLLAFKAYFLLPWSEWCGLSLSAERTVT